MAGYYTSGFPAVTGAQLSQSAAVPVDTGITGGTAAPQTGKMIPGTQILAGAALVALAGGGKAGATQLGYGVNELGTVATGADSALMPYAFPGAMVYVRNDGANSATVFGKGTDTIDAVATGTGNAQAAAKGKLYFGISGNGDGSNAGAWVTLLGA